MNVVQNLIDSSKYNLKCPYSMNAEFYVVHNTANDAPAQNEVAYMIRNDSSTSFHYAVDDKEVVQGIPENRNAWHAGDGSNGNGNRKGIGVEICYSLSGGDRFTKAEQNAAKFIATGLFEKGWDISRVKKHQDFAKKYCPHRTLDLGWNRFLQMVQAELNSLQKGETNVSKYFKDVADDAWYVKEVDYCKEHGLMNGTSTTEFAPENPVTRAQMAAVIARLHKALVDR